MTGLLLEVKALGVSYGQAVAVADAGLAVPQGNWTCLVGPNGAGKTSLVRAVMGLARYRGQVLFDGRPLDRMPAWERQRLGIGYVPEGRQLFPQLTVEENLRMGGYGLTTPHLRDGIDRAFAMFARLQERRSQRAGTLSGGEQQMLALARSLMCRPSFLVVDEISWGVMPLLSQQIFATLAGLNRDGMTILQIEQSARDVLRHAHHAYVMAAGAIVMDGSAASVRSDERVLESYVG